MTKALAIRQRGLPVRDGLDVYLRDITKIPVLSRKEERKLADLWFEKRDPEAGRMLVISNLRFVLKIAREYSRYGLKLSDLVQEGNLGLLRAVDKFDPRKGFRLISYAVWWIRAYIQSFVLRSWSLVRMGTTRVQRRIFSGLQKARRKIAAYGGNSEPSTKQLAFALDVPETELRTTMHRMAKRDLSLDQPVSTQSQISYGERLVDESTDVETKMISSQLQEKVRTSLDDAYDDLAPRERYLLEHRLMSENPATLEAVGKEFGVTRERVRQIEERLKKKLRNILAPSLGEHSVPVSA